VNSSILLDGETRLRVNCLDDIFDVIIDYAQRFTPGIPRHVVLLARALSAGTHNPLIYHGYVRASEAITGYRRQG
jgi:hypothetical protein